MARFRWLAPALLALVVAWLAGGGNGCGRAPSPQLVQVLDLAPREVEAGERVAIVGAGFPPGKPAHLTFRGTLRRPGERPERGAEIAATGVVLGPEQIEMAFDGATQALFCGAGERAEHTTFEGDVEVGFAAALPGAPPVVGELRHVMLDVRPSVSVRDEVARREGERALGWMGLEAQAGASGLVVASVAAGSPAGSAGLEPGDVIVSFDGVRVGTPADVVPARGEREATLGVRRAGATAESTVPLVVDGFRREAPIDLLAAALIVLGALAVALLFGAPEGWSPVSASVQRFVARLRARPTPSSAGRTGLGHAFLSVVRAPWPPAGPPALVDAVACALIAAMPFGQYLVASQLDVGLLFVGAATALVAAALVSAGSTWAGLRAAAHVAWQHVPAALAVASVVVSAGSLRVQEVARAQGGWPWDWLAFRSPGGLLALGLLVWCVRVEPDAALRAGEPAARIEPPAPAAPTARGPWLAAACRAHRLIVLGLASTLLLGGWLLPGVPAGVQSARPALEVAGALWLLLKTWTLVVVVEAAREALPRRTLAARTRRTALVLMPLSAAVLGAAFGWMRWDAAAALQPMTGAVLFGFVALSAVALARRVHHGLSAPGADGRLSPFL